MKNKKDILVIILLLILLGLSVAYNVFGPNGFKQTEKGKAFLEDVIELQSNLSYYVGASFSDSFGLYSKEEILTGKDENGDKIKDNEENVLPALVLEDEVEEVGGKKAYKLNMDYVETTLKIKIDDYEGIDFYVFDGDLVKVKVDSEPEWWSSNFDNLKI